MVGDGLFDGDWQTRLQNVVGMMTDISRQTDPGEMVRVYSERLRELYPVDGFLSVSRRGLEPPKYRIARSHVWDRVIDPWRNRDQLPVFEGGILGDLVYSDEPRIIDDLHVPADDPCAEHFEGMRSAAVIPVFDDGIAKNVVIQMMSQPNGFDPEHFPQMVWMTNLFGRATHNLVLSRELQEMHDRLDGEMAQVATIQQSLLPATTPTVTNLDLSVYYCSSSKAGGDYYDFFSLPDGRLGILLADVSGHGTPAAVLMAITHAIAHLHSGPPAEPAQMLEYLNLHLANRYTREGAFVTAIYGVYDPATREFCYSSAGHPAPRVKHCSDGTIEDIAADPKLPLGILADQKYREHTITLRPGDQVLFFTDGITEARNADGEFFGVEGIDSVLMKCQEVAQGLKTAIVEALEKHTAGVAAEDDVTLLVARIS
ncbi:MAG: PP2C family protein-serine/threonine phosphatase [Planctomycetota bacterium]